MYLFTNKDLKSIAGVLVFTLLFNIISAFYYSCVNTSSSKNSYIICTAYGAQLVDLDSKDNNIDHKNKNCL